VFELIAAEPTRGWQIAAIVIYAGAALFYAVATWRLVADARAERRGRAVAPSGRLRSGRLGRTGRGRRREDRGGGRRGRGDAA